MRYLLIFNTEIFTAEARALLLGVAANTEIVDEDTLPGGRLRIEVATMASIEDILALKLKQSFVKRCGV